MLDEINNYKNNSLDYENPIGEVFIKYFNCSQYIELNFRNPNSELLIHFLSLNCEIFIDPREEVDEISHYNYDAYYAIIKGSLNPKNFKIIPLINTKRIHSKNYKNRLYPLIINSIKINNFKTPELIVKENEPIFLYFNNNLKKINLIYKFENNNIEHPIVVSFFIKEKIKFKIEVSVGQKNIINRYINYKENVIIKPETQKENYAISITSEEDAISSTMIIKIIQNNSIPIYLQKNQLNLGFIPIEVDYYYYYIEVFEGEEGEIILFNKRQNGILISKTIEKNQNIIPKVDDFPKYYEDNEARYLKFNIHKQKLILENEQTKNCKKGCFLLITYYSDISKSLKIKGTEFSILIRILGDGSSLSKAINIPLNEYIFGFFGDIINISNNYYSIYIPYETKNIYLEINGKDILNYAMKGNYEKRIASPKGKGKMIIKLNERDFGLNSFKGEYISFKISKRNNNRIFSYYYFRILQENPGKNYLIYPLDTNKENYCETKNNKCYFLLKNEYNDLSNKISIYFGKNDISYKIFYMNNTDYYSNDLNLNNLNEVKEIVSFNDHLNLDLTIKELFALVVIESNSKKNEELAAISNFYIEQNSSTVNIYSYQLYHLSKKTFHQFYLDESYFFEYRILINNTEGEGYICFNQICDSNSYYIHLKAQKIYSFKIPDEPKFLIYAINNLTFKIKLS